MWFFCPAAAPLPLAFDLHHGVYVLGSSARCQIMIDVPGIEPVHVRLICDQDGTFVVENMTGNANQVVVAGKPIDRCELKPPVEIRLGGVEVYVAPKLSECFHREDKKKLILDQSRSVASVSGAAALTPTLQTVLALMLEGYNCQEIADLMRRAYSTVNKHELALYRVFGVHSRADLLAKYIRGGNSLYPE